MLDWKQVSPLKKWLTVKTDPRVKKTKGGIELPDQLLAVERVMEGTGVVLKAGSKVSEACGYDIETGTRVVFRGFLKDASAMEFLRHEDGCSVFLLRAEDILAVIDDSVQLGAFS